MNYDNICPICFNEFDRDICENIINIAITKCNHKFCLQCIILHGKRKYNCPLCRSEFISPNCVSPTNALSEQIRRDQEMIFDVDNQDEMEVEAWYYGNSQNNSQGQIVPRINIVYDASNVTYSIRDENITNLRPVNNRYNNIEREIDTLDEYPIYHLENSIYDEAISIDSSNTDNEEIENDTILENMN